MARSTARTRVQAFRQLVVLPTLRQALQEGTVTFDHVRALAEHADSPNRDHCSIHHLKPWERGGRSDLDNLLPLCRYHHTWVHDLDGNVTMELLPDRTLRLPGFPVKPCPRRQRPLVERLKHPPDRVPTRA